MVRRSIAVGAGLILLILIVLGVRGCLDARKDRALKDYVSKAGEVASESKQQSNQLFKILGGRGGRTQAVNNVNALNGLRVQSAQLVDRARDLDVPGDMSTAQRFFVETLEFRRDGLATIADALPTALGDQGRRQGTNQVAADMQRFLTSDVVYTQRVVPNVNEALKGRGLTGQAQMPRSQFLPLIDWLDPQFVTTQVDRIRTGAGAGGKPATPGLHGTGLGSVTLGGQALTAGSAATIKLASGLAFQVQVQNQGENTETNVGVTVTVGRGADAIKRDKQLDTIARGESKTVTIPLDQQPPTGQNVPITVEVQPVPGEKKTDNNKGQFSAIFTR